MAACMRYFVSGRVQGVSFRASARNQAARLGLDGYVRNLSDGRVEVLARGDEEALRSLEEWLWTGPPAADVNGVESRSEGGADAPSGFLIR